LRDHANGAAGGVRILADVVAGDFRIAAGDRNERRHHADQRGFSGAVRAQQSENFFFLHAERNVVYRGEFAILLDDVIHFDGVRRILDIRAQRCTAGAFSFEARS
jgi:hypothetical protein